jgi:hypothetical protein
MGNVPISFMSPISLSPVAGVIKFSSKTTVFPSKWEGIFNATIFSRAKYAARIETPRTNNGVLEPIFVKRERDEESVGRKCG